jgi:serine/threonine protein kinase
MGEVWRAEDTRLGRVVAIKVLPPSVVADVEATARLKREARTAAQLYHPSIATIHSIEQDADHIFIVEEFVEGDSLTNVIKRGGLSEAEICRIGRAVADALAEAHAKGIVHRDIKPDNIIVSGNRVKVLDFGIAKQVGIVGASAADTPTASFMTQQGMILGTIHYMSPEQALGKTVDGRSDIFSLGVVLYEMATGRRPFAGETITETMTQIIRDEPTEPLVVNPGITPAMNEIIQRSLRKNPGERFSATELVAALDAYLVRASTAPYTSANTPAANAVTEVATSAAPTLITSSQARTVMEPAAVQPPPRPRRSNGPAVFVVLLTAAISAAAYVANHRQTSPPAAQPAAVKTQPVRPASSSVDVTAPTTGTIVEVPVASETSPVPQAPKKASTATTTLPPSPVKAEIPVPPTATVDEPPPVSAAGNDASADALYAAAMSELVSGDSQQARKMLHRVLEQDPHYAKAHFRMGEIALFNRNFKPAADELSLALGDASRLDQREVELSNLSLAIASHNRVEAERLAAEISERWPNDPDMSRMYVTFPGMFTDFRGQRGRRRLRN